MWKKRMTITVVVVFTLAASFFAGYMLMDGMAGKNTEKNPVDASNNKTAIAETGDHKDKDLVDENTKILKQIKYTKGIEYKTTLVEAPSKDMIGLNMDQAKKYFSDKGFSLLEFTRDEIKVIGEIKDVWPPNVFVIKANDSGVIVVYETDSKGLLKEFENTEIDVNQQPEDVKAEMEKGIVRENEETLGEYLEGLD